MKTIHGIGSICFGLALMTFTVSAAEKDQPANKASPKKAAPKQTTIENASTSQKNGDSSKQAEYEAAFTKKMTKIVLVGAFTVDGQTDKPPREERYEIDSVKKLDGNLWVFNTRIKYGKTDVRLPLSLPVLWAGDTPMISMTDFTIPGMGTFSARVIFHGDRYVGTWQHGKAGGHMFGRIEPAKKAKE